MDASLYFGLPLLLILLLLALFSLLDKDE